MFSFLFFLLYLGKAVLYECAGRHKRTVCFVFLLISPKIGNQMVLGFRFCVQDMKSRFT